MNRYATELIGTQGYFEHIEMEMMVEGGLTPAEVIHASTGWCCSVHGARWNRGNAGGRRAGGPPRFGGESVDGHHEHT